MKALVFLAAAVMTLTGCGGSSSSPAEKALREGKLRAVGLSNYYTPEDFDRLAHAVTIPPAVLQNETHPYHQSTTMKAQHIIEDYGVWDFALTASEMEQIAALNQDRRNSTY